MEENSRVKRREMRLNFWGVNGCETLNPLKNLTFLRFSLGSNPPLPTQKRDKVGVPLFDVSRRNEGI